MSLYKNFKTNSKLEQEGVLLDLGVVRIRLARAGGGNQRYNAAMEKISKQHGKAVEVGALENVRAMTILREAYADTVILDWETNTADVGDEPVFVRGIESEDGELLPVTRENVVNTLKALPDLFTTIQSTAQNMQLFRQSLLDDVVKN